MRLPDGYVLSHEDPTRDGYVIRETATNVMFYLSMYDIMDLANRRIPERLKAVANPYERMVDGWAL